MDFKPSKSNRLVSLLRPYQLPYEYLANPYWNIIITFTTVGYGEMAAKTYLGRLFAVVSMFFGQFIISLILIAMGISAEFTFEETKAFQSLKQIDHFERKIKMASKMIGTWALLKMCERAFEQNKKLYEEKKNKQGKETNLENSNSKLNHSLSKSKLEVNKGSLHKSTGGNKFQDDSKANINPEKEPENNGGFNRQPSIMNSKLQRMNTNKQKFTFEENPEQRFEVKRFKEMGYLKAVQMLRIRFYRYKSSFKQLNHQDQNGENQKSIQAVVDDLNTRLKDNKHKFDSIYGNYSDMLLGLTEEVHVV